jgi:hypothetical protein
MWNKSIFQFSLCNKNGDPLKNENGKVKTVIFITENFEAAKEKFNKLYPNQDYSEWMEFNDKGD